MKKIKGNTYMYENAVCQGGYNTNNHWLIIDSGGNESNAKKSIKAIDYESINYVFNTHFHADHCGGNQYFQNKQEAKIIASTSEACFIEQPILEPVYLFGAYPPKELQNRFLMAKSSVVDIKQDSGLLELELDGESVCFTLLSLKGHSPDMLGIVTPDHIAFIGDAIIDSKIIEKHPLIFSYNIKDHLDTLDYLATCNYDGYVLAHGGYFEQIDELIEINKKAVLRISCRIQELVSSGDKSLENLHKKLSEELELKENLSTYTLNHSVIKAHVQYLIDSEEIKPIIKEGEFVLTSVS